MKKIDSDTKDCSGAEIINFPGGSMQQTVFSPFQWAAPTSTSFGTLSIPHAGKKARRNSYGRAKTLDAAELQRLLIAIQKTRPSPEADIVKVLLSFLAGLRACEIAGLHISDVTKPDGSTSDIIRIRPNISKGGRGREVPMCAELRQAIDVFRSKYPESEWLAIGLMQRTIKHQNANAVTQFFWRLFKDLGLEGCSSHSGRRSFITWACRNLPAGCSLRDVQVMVGHVRLDTTQAYIDCSPSARSLVDSLGAAFANNDGERPR
jgi:integrase/recombinase XerD